MSDTVADDLVARLRDAVAKFDALTNAEVVAHFETTKYAGGTTAIAMLCRRILDIEKWIAETVQERVDELDAEGQAFDRACINVVRYLLRNFCGASGDTVLSEEWSENNALEVISEEFRERDRHIKQLQNNCRQLADSRAVQESRAEKAERSAREEAAATADRIAADPPASPVGPINWSSDWQTGWQDGAMQVAAEIRAMKAAP